MSFSPSSTKKSKHTTSASLAGAAKRPPAAPGDGPTNALPVCTRCRDLILDQYFLRVSPDLEWHQACLRCVECDLSLDETCTCFVRDCKPYCKRDYARLFGARCVQCGVLFCENDLVMRARNQIYHVTCFRCVHCCRQLIPGDEFSLRADNELICRADFDAMTDCREPSESNASELSNLAFDNTDSNDMKMTVNNNNENKETTNNSSRQNVDVTGTPSSVSAGGGCNNASRSGSRSHKSDQKTTRVRTVLNEKQLHTLRTCYGANPRPDALMKEQLVEMTGLSPRVIRVWFQNKRCKDKKRTMLMKQMQQQQQEKGEMCNLEEMWICQKGVPMVATSPVRHETPVNLQLAPIEVHRQCSADLVSITSSVTNVAATAPPWKALSDFALQTELDQPPFQQLVSSFGESSGDEDDDTVVCLEPEPRLRRGSASVHLSSMKQLQQAGSAPLTTLYNQASGSHRHQQTSTLLPTIRNFAVADALC